MKHTYIVVQAHSYVFLVLCSPGRLGFGAHKGQGQLKGMYLSLSCIFDSPVSQFRFLPFPIDFCEKITVRKHNSFYKAAKKLSFLNVTLEIKLIKKRLLIRAKND